MLHGYDQRTRYATGETRDPAAQREAFGWTRRPPPALAAGQYAVFAGRGWIVTEAPPQAPSIDELKAYLEAAHRRTRDAGISVNGLAVETDPDNYSLTMGAYALARDDDTLTQIDWWAPDGSFVTIPRADMLAIGIAVGRHIQTAYSRARQASDAISSGTATTFAEIDAIMEGSA